MKRLLLGKIAAAHGIKGQVKLFVTAEDPHLLDGHVYTSETGDDILTLHLKNKSGKFWLADIEGLSNRTQAETLRGTELWLDRDKLPEPEAGEFYYADLVGMTVMDEQDNEIGRVIAVENFGAGDLLEVKPASAPSFYLPFTNETAPDIDMETKRIIAKIPDGLLD